MLTTMSCRQALETEGLLSDKRLPGIAERSIKMDGVVSWSSNSDKLPDILIPGAICSLTTGFLEHGNAGLTWHGGVGGLWNDKKLGFDGDAELLGHTGSQHGAFMHL